MQRRMFYGWVVVGGAFTSHFLNYGTLVVAFGIFFPFMAESLGWGRGLLASATLFARITFSVGAPFLGRQIDKRGPRPFIFLGGIALAGGAGLLSLVNSPWQLFLVYGVLMALGGMALGPLNADSTVAKWFVRRRGRALAFSTMGMSAAGVALPLPLSLLIVQVGWREAWAFLGVFIILIALIVAPFMRRRPEDYGMVPDGQPMGKSAEGSTAVVEEVSLTAKEAVRTPAFWLLVASTNLAGLAISGVNLHIFSYITDRGISAGVAAGAITYLYCLQSIAKPLWGFVAERLHVRYCLATCYLGGALGIMLLMGASTLAGFVIFASIYGLTRGAQSFISSLAWSDYFGRAAQGAIRGTAAPFGFVSSVGGPVLGGLLFDLKGDYMLAFSVFVVAFLSASLAALMARPPQIVVLPVEAD